jgi:hypothetical protein
VSVTRVTAFTAAESRAEKLVAGTTLFDVDWIDLRAEWVPHDPVVAAGQVTRE